MIPKILLIHVLNTLNSALYNNIAGASLINGRLNTAVCSKSLFSNTTGSDNIAIGFKALYSNTTGSNNIAVGDVALSVNDIGTMNIAVGENALGNSTGSYNIAIGLQALLNNQTGNQNTGIGVGADVSSSNLTNATAIGWNAKVNASNKVRIGNTQVTVIEGQVPFSWPSDQRLKKNIKDLISGLDLILKLRPVEYQMKQGDGKTNFGFIAQDIETLVGTNNSLLTIGADTDRTLGLRYTDLIAPMVKAIQEQQKQIESVKQENNQLKSEIDELKAIVRTLIANKTAQINQ